MANIGNLFATVSLDSTKFRAGANSTIASLGSLTKFATGAIGIFGAFETAKFGIGLAAQAEQAEVAFTTMLGSVQEAQKLMGQLQQFAAKTPFEFPELRDASKKLIAFGVAGGDVVPTMRILGDLSAGIGTPVGELAELYGKAKVQGRLFMEDINQLTGRGIPITQELAKQFNVSTGEVRKLVEKGRVGFPELQRALIDLTAEGSQFGGMMEKQSTTLQGKWSNLMDGIKADLTGAAQIVVEKLTFKETIDGASKLTEKLTPITNTMLLLVDEVDFVSDMFGFAKAGAVGFFAAIAEGVARTLGMVEKLPKSVLESMPGGAGLAFAMLGEDGVVVNAESARAFADSMNDQGLAMLKEAQANFNALSPSQQFLANMAGGVDDVKKALKPDEPTVFDVMAQEVKQADAFLKDLDQTLFGINSKFSGDWLKAAEFAKNPAIDTDKVDAMFERLREIDAAKQQRELDRFASTLDPLETFRRDMAKLEAVRGTIGDDVFRRESKRLRQSAVSGMMGDTPNMQSFSAISAGSQQAYSTLARFQNQATDPQTEIAKDIRERVDKAVSELRSLNRAELLKVTKDQA